MPDGQSGEQVLQGNCGAYLTAVPGPVDELAITVIIDLPANITLLDSGADG